MFIFPPVGDPCRSLLPGVSQTMKLKGKAGSSTNVNTAVQFKIYAAVDMDWLFSRDQDSFSCSTPLNL
jgi:hypothetical protein